MIHQPGPTVDVSERTRDLFTVLWAFSRIDAVRQTLPAWQLFGGRLAGPHKLLMHTTRAWVEYWGENVEEVRAGLDADVHGSDLGLMNLASAWR